MADLQPYDVEDAHGNPTTLLLSEDDAIARGLVKGKEAPAAGSSRDVVTAEPVQLEDFEVPTSYGSTTLRLTKEEAKARGLLGDSAEDLEQEQPAKAVRSPANKQRTATNK